MPAKAASAGCCTTMRSPSRSPRPARNADKITGGCTRGEGTAGKLLTDEALWTGFNSLSDRIDKVIGTLETATVPPVGCCTTRRYMRTLNGAANELKQLIADIRKDPKKYLNVRVSIF